MAEHKKESSVAGVFESVEQADAAISELLEAGFSKKSIGFLSRETEEVKKQTKAEAAGDATVIRSVGGGVTGGVLGGLIGSLAAIALPGIGPVVMVGLFAAAGGAIAGTFTGLMSSVGLSDEETAWFLGELKSGRYVVVVRTDGRYSEALAILQTHGGYDMTRQRESNLS